MILLTLAGLNQFRKNHLSKIFKSVRASLSILKRTTKKKFKLTRFRENLPLIVFPNSHLHPKVSVKLVKNQLGQDKSPLLLRSLTNQFASQENRHHVSNN
jgi:hypothetical protein